MIIYYRISDGSYPKPKFQNATKYQCLKNVLNTFKNSNMYIYADNVSEELYNKILS